MNIHNNSIMILKPYKHHGTWVFDDADTGLVKEAFVSGTPAIIEAALAKQKIDGENGFRLLFSGSPFPGMSTTLTWIKAEYGGNWYKDEDGREGWLCPSLFKYFREAPKQFYAKAERL